MNIIQVDLVSVGRKQDGFQPRRLMTTWVEDRPDLKIGVDIELKKVEGLWRVVKIYNEIHSADDFDWHKKFKNNI